MIVKLTILNDFPTELLEINSTELLNILPGPTLIKIKGEENKPLFISTLLHGNETTGFKAIQQYLKSHNKLPRTLFLFLGNIKAASLNLRRLQEQADYNRVWDGNGDTAEHRMAQQLLNELQQYDLFAAIDIHNNTGKNPHYACINYLQPEYINLAALFNSKIVYFTTPHEVISIALAKLCPSVILECGLSSSNDGVIHVLDYLEKVINLPDIDITQHKPDNNIYQTIVKINVPRNVTIGFGDAPDEQYDFTFHNELENYNFVSIPRGTTLGWRKNQNQYLIVTDENGKTVSDLFFHYEQNEIICTEDVVPSMFTKDIKTIHLDCLGYFMKKMII